MRRGVVRAFVATQLAVVGFAVADPQPPVVLQWSAPPDVCPDAAYVLGEIERLLGGAAGPSTVRAKAKVTLVDDVYEVQLTTEVTSNGVVRKGARRLAAPTCRKLADATALVLALAVDPDRVGAVEASGAVPSSSSPSAVASSPPSAVPPSVASVASTAPPPTIPAAAPTPEPSSPRSTNPRRWVVGAETTLLLGLVPGVTLGLGLTAGLELERLRVDVNVGRSFDQRASLAARPTAGGTFSVTSALLRGRWGTHPARWRVFVGGLVGLHRVGAEGYGVPRTSEATTTTLSLGPTLELLVGLAGPLRARLGFSALAPWPRRTYALDGVGDLHTVAPVLLHTGLGLEAAW